VPIFGFTNPIIKQTKATIQIQNLSIGLKIDLSGLSFLLNPNLQTHVVSFFSNIDCTKK